MSKFTKKKIDTMKEIAAQIVAVANTNAAEAIKLHHEFNSNAIQALIGGEVKSTKKGINVVFTKALPSTAELSEIADVCEGYARRMSETSLFKATDDMAVLSVDPTAAIPEFSAEKVNNKTLKAYFLDPLGIVNNVLDSSDCIKIASWGSTARKNAIIKNSIIIGGVTVAVGAGIAVGVVAHNKKKSEAADGIELIDLDKIEVIDEVAEVTDVTLEAFNSDVHLGF